MSKGGLEKETGLGHTSRKGQANMKSRVVRVERGW